MRDVYEYVLPWLPDRTSLAGTEEPVDRTHLGLFPTGVSPAQLSLSVGGYKQPTHTKKLRCFSTKSTARIAGSLSVLSIGVVLTASKVGKNTL
eukprot:scaffold672911_cov59-Prasinocladus_malaysianus.AAC.1